MEVLSATALSLSVLGSVILMTGTSRSSIGTCCHLGSAAIIIYFNIMWLSWYWIVCAFPCAFMAYFFKVSPIRAKESVVNANYSREWHDIMVTSNISYIIAALVSLYCHQYHLAFICLWNSYSSVLYHRARETAYYNLDSVFAQFQGFLLIWVCYCAYPSVSPLSRIMDWIFSEGFSDRVYTFWSSLLLEHFDDGCEGNTNSACHSAQYKPVDPNVLENMTCSSSDEFFWAALLAVPLGMVLLESCGENALVQPVLTKGIGRGSSTTYLSVLDRSDKDTSLTSLQWRSGGASKGGYFGSVCLCTRAPNPQYERFHPVWHVTSMLGPIFTCIFFTTQCEPSVLGSVKTVHIPALPFIDLLELPLVPTALLLISMMNSIQLNITGIKPPE